MIIQPIDTINPDRIESGPVQFNHIGAIGQHGEDWPGVFIRGDDCMFLRSRLEEWQADRKPSIYDQPIRKLLDYIELALVDMPKR